MQRVCRIGDQGEGICLGHKNPTRFTTVFQNGGDSILTVDGVQVCVVGTIGQASCGHQTIATTGGFSTSTDGKALHRVGDKGVSMAGGEYTATTGSDYFVSD